MKYKVKTDRIAVGQEYKNFKELCRALKLPQSTYTLAGSSRKSVMKEIERYIQYEKSGQKFIIKEIYKEPLPKIDKRLAGVYARNLEIILYKYFLAGRPDNDKCSQYMTPLSWCKVLGICNRKYKEESLEVDLQPTDKRLLHEFYYHMSGRMNGLLLASLKSLKRQKLIDYTKGYILHFDDGSERLSTAVEAESIQQAEENVLAQMGLHSLFHVRARMKYSEFYEAVTNSLNEDDYAGEFSGITRYERAIDISCSVDKMLYRVDSLKEYSLDDADILELIKQNNEIVADNIKKSVEKKVEKDSEQNHTLLCNMEYLVNELIRLKDDEIPDTCEEFFHSREM